MGWQELKTLKEGELCSPRGGAMRAPAALLSLLLGLNTVSYRKCTAVSSKQSPFLVGELEKGNLSELESPGRITDRKDGKAPLRVVYAIPDSPPEYTWSDPK